MAVANVKYARLCVFCKFWYDPTFAHLKPRNPRGGFWEYDAKAKAMCQQWSLHKAANASCPKFVSRLPTPDSK